MKGAAWVLLQGEHASNADRSRKQATEKLIKLLVSAGVQRRLPAFPYIPVLSCTLARIICKLCAVPACVLVLAPFWRRAMLPTLVVGIIAPFLISTCMIDNLLKHFFLRSTRQTHFPMYQQENPNCHQPDSCRLRLVVGVPVAVLPVLVSAAPLPLELRCCCRFRAFCCARMASWFLRWFSCSACSGHTRTWPSQH